MNIYDDDIASRTENEQAKRKELETILNRINDAIVSVDNDWRYTFLNDGALATHPLGKKETLGKVIWDVHPGMKGTLFWDKYHEAMLTKKVVEMENYYAPMDIWFAVKVYPSVDGLTIFYKNVTESKKTEQQLLQTLKEVTDYKFALDESSIIAITDQKGIISHANYNFCKISKYSVDELIGQDHRIINSGYHSKEFIKNLWTTISNGKIWKGELKNKAKDGTVYWVDTTIVPFLNEQGKPYQYIAIRSDITERKKLEERQALFASIVNSSDDAILSKTLGGIIMTWNRGAEKIFGYSSKEIIGKHISILIPSHLQNEETEIMEKINKGKGIEHYETERIRKDGRIIDVSLTISPIKDAFGNIIGASKISRDITGPKRGEQELQAAHERFQYATQASSDIIWELNFKTNQYLVHDSKEKRYGVNTIIDWELGIEGRYIVEEDREKVQYSFRVAKMDKVRTLWEYEYRVYSQDNSVLFIINHAMFIRDDKGKAVRVIGSITDITERKRSELELLEQQRSEQLKLTAIALEAQEKERNILGQELHDNVNQILVGSKLLLSMVKNSSEKNQELINSSINHLQEAIDENRKLSHRLVTPDLDLNTLAKQLSDLAYDMLERSGIKTRMDTSSLQEDLLTDQQKIAIYRIAQEQCTNIFKYAKAAAATISLRTTGGLFKMLISDNGQGMEEGTTTMGIGIRNINARISIFHGKATIKTEPGKGFTLEVEMPVKQ